jgi:hypothetical protein
MNLLNSDTLNTAKNLYEQKIAIGGSLASMGAILVAFMMVTKVVKKAIGAAILVGILVVLLIYLKSVGVF